MFCLELIEGGETYDPRMRGIPRFVIIEKSTSEIAWFNNLIGEEFEVLDINHYNYIKICYDPEFGSYGWLPLDCCKSHLKVV